MSITLRDGDPLVASLTPSHLYLWMCAVAERERETELPGLIISP